MMRHLWRGVALGAMVLGLLGDASGTARANLITNGDFQTGDLTGWTVFANPNGTNGKGFPVVSSFDVNGAGASRAAEFRVGKISGGFEGGGGCKSRFVEPGWVGSSTVTFFVRL